MCGIIHTLRAFSIQAVRQIILGTEMYSSYIGGVSH